MNRGEEDRGEDTYIVVDLLVKKIHNHLIISFSTQFNLIWFNYNFTIYFIIRHLFPLTAHQCHTTHSTSWSYTIFITIKHKSALRRTRRGPRKMGIHIYRCNPHYEMFRCPNDHHQFPIKLHKCRAMNQSVLAVE